MNAAELTAALGGRWLGREGICRCPAHDDRDPSLSIRDGDDGRMLTHCFAGCEPDAVWDALTARGLVPAKGDTAPRPRCQPRHRQRQRGDDGRQAAALALWRAARPIVGEPAEDYLRNRGIWLPVPPTLRYHPGVKYEQSGLLIPCMIAAVQAPDRRVVAVHRTFIRSDAEGKANVSTPKMALGPIGAGAVRLGHVAPVLGLAEGVETALSAMQLFGVPVWSALGSRMDRVTLPAEVREIQIFGDNGDPGHEAAERAADVLTRQGRRVVLRYPPQDAGDWNDVVQAQEARPA